MASWPCCLAAATAEACHISLASAELPWSGSDSGSALGPVVQRGNQARGDKTAWYRLIDGLHKPALGSGISGIGNIMSFILNTDR